MANTEDPPEALSIINPKRTPDHPPYSEMIRVAIDALNETGGSKESRISEYIASTFSGLPNAHPNLLAYHIRKLTRLGEFTMTKNNTFLNPNPNPNSVSIPFLDGPNKHKAKPRAKPKPKPKPKPATIISWQKRRRRSSLPGNAGAIAPREPKTDDVDPGLRLQPKGPRRLVLVRNNVVLLTAPIVDSVGAETESTHGDESVGPVEPRKKRVRADPTRRLIRDAEWEGEGGSESVASE